jgi:type IV pilus assembly protein PilX
MKAQASAGRTRAHGVVLIMALILLILISFLAALAARHAVSGEQVSNALRTNTVAFQAAETALRFCEDQILRHGMVVSGDTTRVPQPYALDGTAPELWRTRANWDPAKGIAVAIDTGIVDSKDSAARRLGFPPRCMVEERRLNEGDGRRKAFLITAVGFSSDYRLGGSGKPESGGEVWLQSTVSR